MTQWRAYGRGGPQLENGAENPAPLFGTQNAVASQTEAEIQIKAYTAYTWSDLAAFIGVADADAVVELRDDGVDSTNLVVAGSATGYAEDTTGSDTPATDSLMSVNHNDSAAMHGASFQVGHVLCTYEHASTESPLSANAAGSNQTTVAASTTRYFGIDAAVSRATESQAQSTVRRSQSYSNLRVYITAAPASGNEIAMRINGSTSTNVTVSPTATGAIEDVTGSEAYGDDDEINGIMTAGAGSALTFSAGQWQADTAEKLYAGAVPSFDTSSTAYINVVGGTFAASEEDLFTCRIGSTTAGSLRTNVTVYNSGTDVFSWRTSGTDSTNLTVDITATGVVEDTTGSEAVADTDESHFRLTASGTRVDIVTPSVELPWSAAFDEAEVAGLWTKGQQQPVRERPEMVAY